MLTSRGLRVVYAGTPDFAVPALKALIASEHDVVGVLTQPDRPSGRGRKLVFGPIKQVALANHIPLFQPSTLHTSDAKAMLSSLNADILVVAAYGLILPQTILNIPRYGCFNIHGSLLPAWRGAAPIQRSIANGDLQTGITIMQMDAGLDTGDILHTISCPITHNDTGQTIHDQLANIGAEGLLAVLEQVNNQMLAPRQQDTLLSSYAHKLTKAEALIDWKQKASTIDYQIRAFNPWPVAFTYWQGKPVKCLFSALGNHMTHTPAGLVIGESKQGIEVATGQGSLLIKKLQLPGKKAMNVLDFLNGRSMLGDTLGL